MTSVWTRTSGPGAALGILVALCLGCGGNGGGAEEVLLVASANPVEPVLGLGGGGGDAGDLYVLDPASGELLGTIDTSGTCEAVPCEIGRTASAAWDPGAQLLVAGMGGSGGLCSGCILTIDLATGVAEVLWDNAALQSAVGMAFNVDAVPGMARRGDGTFFATVRESEGGAVGLVSFTRTQAPVFVATTGVAEDLMLQYDIGNALAFDDAGTLFYTTGAGLSTIDPATADATHQGAVSYEGFGVLAEDEDFTRITSMAILPDGTTVGVLHDDGLRFFGTLDRVTRVFSTTDFYEGSDFETETGMSHLGGLSSVPRGRAENAMEPVEPVIMIE